MKLSDYVVEFLVKRGVKNIFGLTGGAVVHLFDSVDKNPNIQPIYCHHEQAAALAAASYSRISRGLGVAMVTTGPGGTNAITGVTAAWLDSIPCMIISGQSRKDHTSYGKPVRQLGSQELNIIPLVTSVTKYAVMIEDPRTIRYHLEKAAHLAMYGRPGPVWIDIPLNFQWASIEPEELESFYESEMGGEEPSKGGIDTNDACNECIDLITKSKRPLILLGFGVRLARAEDDFRELIDQLGIPFISSWTASDMVPADHPLYIGRPGVVGQRGGNLAVQNCDLLICIGSHLSIPLTGTLFKAFARDAKVVMIDIDRNELDYETVHVEYKYRLDAREFIRTMIGKLSGFNYTADKAWIDRCDRYKSLNKIPEEWKEQKDWINSYVFVDMLSELLDQDDIISVDGGGTVVYTAFQAFRVKPGQRLVASSGICAMGTGLPESIGACVAGKNKRTVCLCGDGSMQLNIQELQTIFHHKFNIKIFIFNNDGYLAIRHTQNGFLNRNYAGSHISGGLSLPDYQHIAAAYGIKSFRAQNHGELKEKILTTLNTDGPAICEIMIDREQQVIPSQGFDPRGDGTFMPRPLEDMYPYIDRNLFDEIMVVESFDPKKL